MLLESNVMVNIDRHLPIIQIIQSYPQAVIQYRKWIKHLATSITSSRPTLNEKSDQTKILALRHFGMLFKCSYFIQYTVCLYFSASRLGQQSRSGFSQRHRYHLPEWYTT